MLLGALVGWWLPATAFLALAVEPLIVLLLFSTFLAVPLQRIREAFGDPKFMVLIGGVNFIAVPVIVFGLTRGIATNEPVYLAVLLVLLAPCIDYVIVFTGIAGGAAHKLLAVTPLLMLAQILLLPVLLWLMLGPSASAVIDPAPFVRAFLVLIAVPLGAAALLQRWSRAPRAVAVVTTAAESAMDLLMMTTLFAVVASQVRGVGEQIAELVSVVPVFIAFVVVMVFVGVIAGRVGGLRSAERRALTFSGVTRNSLVVLPLALALPPSASGAANTSMAPLVVVTQTLIELVAMVVLVRLLPRMVRGG